MTAVALVSGVVAARMVAVLVEDLLDERMGVDDLGAHRPQSLRCARRLPAVAAMASQRTRCDEFQTSLDGRMGWAQALHIMTTSGREQPIAAPTEGTRSAVTAHLACAVPAAAMEA
jgi:hypothetical protein